MFSLEGGIQTVLLVNPTCWAPLELFNYCMLLVITPMTKILSMLVPDSLTHPLAIQKRRRRSRSRGGTDGIVANNIYHLGPVNFDNGRQYP